MIGRFLALGLILLPLAGYCQATPDQLKGRFATEERILLSGLLLDPQQARAFADDGLRLDKDSFMILWRSRLAAYAEDYLAKEHPVNEKAASVRQAIEPGEWSMLMASLRELEATGAIKDQITLKVFLGMLDEADKGLAEGDPTDLRRAVKIAKPKVVASMRKLLSDDVTKKAVAEQARRDAAASSALEQAEAAAREANSIAQSGAGVPSQIFDGARPPATQPSNAALPDNHSPGHPTGLTRPIGSVAGRPSLTVIPSPSVSAVSEDNDMAELRAMKRRAKAAGAKRGLLFAGAGLAIGAAIGMGCGGPLGMVLGGLLGAAVGFFAGKLL